MPEQTNLSDEEMRRYARHISLPSFGIEGQNRLKESSVLCIGAGGLGSPSSMYLAAAGVGRIGLVDMDKVDASNIQRQLLHGTNDIGRKKIESAKDTIYNINPNVQLETFGEAFKPENSISIAKNYDIIIDGTDNFKTKFLVNDYCLKLKKKLVTGAISKFDGHIFTFDFKDKNVASLKNFYQENEIQDDALNCEFEGVLGTTASIVGATQANEALKMIIEIGRNLKNQLLIIDLLNLNFRKVKFKKR